MKPNRTQLALGVALLIFGGWLIAVRTMPDFAKLVEQFTTGSLAVVGAGAIIFLLGLILGSPGLSVPAAIVAGIGGILWYQETYSDPASWSYMWALIPGFVGVGNILSGILGGGSGQVKSGLNLIMTSAVLFVIFAALFGRLDILGAYTPSIVLVGAGLWFIVRSFFKKEQAS
jgi:hypothetical protein